MNQVYSPLTENTNVKLVNRLNVTQIKNNYKSDIHIDVSRFFEGLDYVEIYECQQSGLQFYYPFSLAGDADFYAQLSKTYKSYYSPWKWEHQIVYKHLKPGLKVLEIGCGYGYFLERAKQTGCDVLGLELNEDAVKYGQDNNLPITNESLETHAEKFSETYDIVCAFQVYEHVSNVRDMLIQAVRCLNKGGILALGVPNNDSYLFKEDLYHTLNLPPHHTLLWAPGSLAYLPQILPLETLQIVTEPANKNHRSSAYRLFLKKYLKNEALINLIHMLTRPVVKMFPVIDAGATVVSIFKKR